MTTLIGSEVERLRAPERASEAAQAAFLAAVLRRQVTDRGDIVARAAELGVDVAAGSAVVVVRTHHYAPADEDWRVRVLAAAERAARASAPGSLAAVVDTPTDAAGHVVVLLPAESDAEARRVGGRVARELRSSLHGFTFAVGHSRVATDPVDLYRAGNEALLAANVAEAGPDDSVLAFEETGAYRLLLPAMSEDPAELQRFFAETVEPLVTYDEQYDTDLVQTLETFLDADANVAGTASRLFTHRHTIRYRLERVRDLTGLDVSSTDGREKLGLGLEGDARARRRRAARTGDRERRRGRPRAPRAARPLEDLRAPRCPVGAERAAGGDQRSAAQLLDAAGAGEVEQRRAAEEDGAELGDPQLETCGQRGRGARRRLAVPAQRPAAGVPRAHARR